MSGTCGRSATVSPPSSRTSETTERRPSKPWGCPSKTLTPTPEPAGYWATDVAGERGGGPGTDAGVQRPRRERPLALCRGRRLPPDRRLLRHGGTEHQGARGHPAIRVRVNREPRSPIRGRKAVRSERPSRVEREHLRRRQRE